MKTIHKVTLSIEEIGLIEHCLEIVLDSLDRGDLQDFTSDKRVDEIEEYNSQGYFDDLITYLKRYK